MGKGRASANSLLAVAGGVIPGDRLAPPDDLAGGDLAREEWLRVVNGLPPGFITIEHESLMREYVRHVVFARRSGDEIERLTELRAKCEVDGKDWLDLSRRITAEKTEHKTQTEAMQRLGRALRINKQSRYERTERANKRTTAAPKPWADWSNNPAAAGAGERRRDS
jgi:hypothetical protein